MPLVGFVAWRWRKLGTTNWQNLHLSERQNFIDLFPLDKKNWKPKVSFSHLFRHSEITNLGKVVNMGPLQPIWEGFAPTLGVTNMIRFQDQDLHDPASASKQHESSLLDFFLLLFALCCNYCMRENCYIILHCIHDMFATQFLRQAWPSACASFLLSSWQFSTPSSFWRLQLCIGVHFDILHLCDSVGFCVSLFFWYWVQETCTRFYLLAATCCVAPLKSLSAGLVRNEHVHLSLQKNLHGIHWGRQRFVQFIWTQSQVYS